MTDAMPELATDAQSLADYARTKSPDALASLVRRYVDLVYATARRMVGDPTLAEDVTQAAFIVLVKKADRLDPISLPGWLVGTTRLAAKQAMRSNSRRKQHESRAAEQRAAALRSADAISSDEPTADELRPLLDDALAQLSEADRTAIVLRFLQGQTFTEVGIATGTSEEAARKRVGRAVEKLRTIFMKQGILASAGGLMIVLAAEQAKAAPASVVGAATAAATGGTVGGTLLAKGTVTVMKLAELKLAAAVLIGLAAAGTLVFGVRAMQQAVAQTPAVSSAAPSTQPSTTQPAEAALIGRLSDGTTSELLAVFDPSSKAWWRGDGTPCKAPYPERDFLKLYVQRPNPAKQYLVLITRIKSTNPNAAARFDDEGQSHLIGSDGATDRTAHILELNPGLKVISQRYVFATDAPKLLVMKPNAAGQWDPAAAVEMAIPNVGTYRISSPGEVKGKATFRIERPDDAPGSDIADFEVTRADGRTDNYGYVWRDNIQTMTLEQSLADTKQCQISVVHYSKSIEFRNVSLTSGAQTDAKVVVVDDAPPAATQATNPPPDATLADLFRRLQKTITVDSPASSNESFRNYPPYGELWDRLAKAAWQADQPMLAEIHKLRNVQTATWPPGLNVFYLNAGGEISDHLADAAFYEHVQGDDASAGESVGDLLHLAGLLDFQQDFQQEGYGIRPLVSMGLRARASHRTMLIASGVRITNDPNDKTALQTSQARDLIKQLFVQRDPKALADAIKDWAFAGNRPELSKPKFVETCNRDNAEQTFAAVSLAAHLFRFDYNRWPTTMAELVPAYLPSVPVDPWGDGKQPFGYVLIKAGLPDGSDRPLVYSRCQLKDGLFFRIDQPMYRFYLGDGSSLPRTQQKDGGQFRDIAQWVPPPDAIRKQVIGRWQGKEKTLASSKMTFDGDHVHISDAGSEEDWRYTIDTTHVPTQIDLTADKSSLKGVIELHNSELRVGLGDTERPKRFDPRDDDPDGMQYFTLFRTDGVNPPTTQPLP